MRGLALLLAASWLVRTAGAGESCSAPAVVLERSNALSTAGVDLYALDVGPGTARLVLTIYAVDGSRSKPYARVGYGAIPSPAAESASASPLRVQLEAAYAVVQGEARLDWPREGCWFVAVSYEPAWDSFNLHQWIAPRNAGRYRLRIEAAGCGEGLAGDCNCSAPVVDVAPGAAAAVPPAPEWALFRAWLPLDAPAALTARVEASGEASFRPNVAAIRAPAAGPPPAAGAASVLLERPEGGRHQFFAATGGGSLALDLPRCPPGRLGPACTTPVVPLVEGREARAEAAGGATAWAAEVAAASVGLALRLALRLEGADPASLFLAARLNGLPPPAFPDAAAAAAASPRDGRASGLDELGLPPLQFAASGPAAARTGSDLPWCPFGHACFEIARPAAGRLFVLATAAPAAANGTWAAAAVLQRGGCPRACSGRGECVRVEGATAGLLWEACACPRPWGGPDCSRPTRPLGVHAAQAALLTATNGAIVPAVLAARRAGLPLEAAAFGATGLASAVYHVCDSDLACLGLPYGPLQLLDILLSTYAMSLAAALLAGPAPAPSPRHFLTLLALVFAVAASRFSPWPVLVAVVPALLLAALRLRREPARRRALLGPGRPRRHLLLAAASAAAAFLLLPLQTDGNYWLLHSVWHVAAMLAPYFLVRCAAAGPAGGWGEAAEEAAAPLVPGEEGGPGGRAAPELP